MAGEELFRHDGGIIEVANPVILPANVDFQRCTQLELLVENRDESNFDFADDEENQIMIWGGKKPYATAIIESCPPDLVPVILEQEPDGSPKFTLTGTPEEGPNGSIRYELSDKDYERRFIITCTKTPKIVDEDFNEVDDLTLSVDPNSPNHTALLTFCGGFNLADVNWSAQNSFFDLSVYFTMRPGIEFPSFFGTLYFGNGPTVLFTGLLASPGPIVVTASGLNFTSDTFNLTIE